MNQRTIKANKTSNKVQVKSTKMTVLKTFKVSKQYELLAFLFEKITNDSKNNIKRYLSFSSLSDYSNIVFYRIFVYWIFNLFNIESDLRLSNKKRLVSFFS